MKTIPISDIVVPENRQRKVFDKVKADELCASITSKGLFHAIVLRNDSKTLVAGERRIKAVSALAEALTPITYDQQPVPIGHIPFVTLSELSAEALYEAELEENLSRDDLKWQEKAAAIKALHELRTKQAVERGEVQTLTDTAREVSGKEEGSVSHERLEVRDAILLSAHLQDPDVAKAKSQKEAVNIVRKKLAATFDEALDQAYTGSEVASNHKAICGDCVEEMKKLPSNEFDVILTDPPYGVGADTWTTQSSSESGLKHEYSDDEASAIAATKGMLAESMRVTKAQAHLYMFCDIRQYEKLAILVRDAGWDVWYVPLIWSKSGQGMLLGRADGPRKTYEACLYARKGGKPVNQVGADVIDLPSAKGELHAAQKPVDLYVHLLRWSCIPGDKVLDPFMGSGTIFPAANELKLFATGIEKSKQHFAVAHKRINHGVDETAELDF